MDVWKPILLSLLTVIVGMFATSRIRAYTIKKNILDRPNERSAHKIPTPRGGGLGFLIGFTFGLVASWAAGASLPSGMAWAWFGSVMVAVIGWVDDRMSLSPRVRLVVHFAGSMVMLAPLLLHPTQTGVLLNGILPSMNGLWLGTLPIWLHVLFGGVLIVGSVWLLNLYNFMDGIDGIAGSEAVTAGLTLGALCLISGQPAWGLVYFLLAAAVAGFLVFNWPPARIFMGDVGSGFLGVSFAGIGLLSAAAGGPGVVILLIALGVFIVDATYTLFDRWIQGKKLSQSHSEHAYQHASRRWGHRPVTIAVVCINVFGLAPLAYLAALRPELQYMALAVAYVPLTVLCFGIKRAAMRAEISNLPMGAAH